MKILTHAVALTALATGGAATAQTANEARCIVLSNVFAKEGKDPQAQKMAEAALYFYLGRVSPQATPAQIKSQLDTQMRTITDANAGTLMGDCIKGVQKEIAVLQTIAGSTPQVKPAPTPGQPEGR